MRGRRLAKCSTVESKKLIASLADEDGREIGSEKLLEIDFDGNRPVRNGDQFGIGARGVRR